MGASQSFLGFLDPDDERNRKYLVSLCVRAFPPLHFLLTRLCIKLLPVLFERERLDVSKVFDPLAYLLKRELFDQVLDEYFLPGGGTATDVALNSRQDERISILSKLRSSEGRLSGDTIFRFQPNPRTPYTFTDIRIGTDRGTAALRNCSEIFTNVFLTAHIPFPLGPRRQPEFGATVGRHFGSPHDASTTATALSAGVFVSPPPPASMAQEESLPCKVISGAMPCCRSPIAHHPSPNARRHPC